MQRMDQKLTWKVVRLEMFLCWTNQLYFVGANLKGACLDSSQMNGVNLRLASLKGASMKLCGLRFADMAGTDLEVKCFIILH